MFAVISILALAGLWLLLAFRRFRMKEMEAARKSLGDVELTSTVRAFGKWLGERSLRLLGRDGRADWTARFKALPLWRLPVLEKWLLVVLYATFLYLAASGFFFAIFVRRGLYGLPLLFHFTAGVIFAMCLALAALLKARKYARSPAPLALPVVPEGFSLKRDWRVIGGVSIGGPVVVSGLFWLFLLAGLSLTVTALFPMLPWFHYQGQQILFGWHRWSALVSLLAAIAFADLEFFAPNRPPA